MQAGRMRHQIRLERKASGQDSAGGETVTWNLLKETRASVEPTSGNEAYIKESKVADVSHTVRIRYTEPMPKADDRVVFDGRNFDIKSVILMKETKRDVILACEEIVLGRKKDGM